MTFPTGLHTAYTLTDNVDTVVAAHPNTLSAELRGAQVKIGIDSSADNTSLDYFLKHASGAYRTHTHDASSDDGAKLPLGSLSDFAVAGATNGQVLQYNSTSGKWANATLASTLDSLSDVAITSAVTREGIYYNGSSWVNGYPNAVYAS